MVLTTPTPGALSLSASLLSPILRHQIRSTGEQRLGLLRHSVSIYHIDPLSGAHIGIVIVASCVLRFYLSEFET